MPLIPGTMLGPYAMLASIGEGGMVETVIFLIDLINLKENGGQPANRARLICINN